MKGKLTYDQVLEIPKLLKTRSTGSIAKEWGVSWQAVWYWIRELRKRGVEIETRKRGSVSILDVKKVRKGGKPKIPFDCNCDTDRPLTKFERELSQGLNEFLAKKLKPKLKIDKKRVKISKIVEDMERSMYERAVGKKG